MREGSGVERFGLGCAIRAHVDRREVAQHRAELVQVLLVPRSVEQRDREQVVRLGLAESHLLNEAVGEAAQAEGEEIVRRTIRGLESQLDMFVAGSRYFERAGLRMGAGMRDLESNQRRGTRA